jgi:protein disulfide isomerase family A protein 3
VRGYPTIYWVPKNNKQSPSKYEGGREVDDIVKWIDENRSDKGGREDL